MVTTIDTPTYTLDGWVGNATDDDGVDWIVVEETGWSDGAPVRLTVADREGIDGGLSGPVLRGARLITLKGVAMAPDQATMLAAKDRWHTIAAGDGATAYPLVVGEAHLERQTDVKLAAEPKARDIGAVAFGWELLLRADDPVRYASGDATTASTPLPTGAAGGITFPVTFPITFGAGGVGGMVVVTNAGNTPVWPVFRITGPVTNPSIQNATTERTLAFGLDLAADEWLDIDTAQRTVLLNGTANRRNTLLPSSVWWPLVAGGNEVRFNAAAFTASQLDITYRSGWK